MSRTTQRTTGVGSATDPQALPTLHSPPHTAPTPTPTPSAIVAPTAATASPTPPARVVGPPEIAVPRVTGIGPVLPNPTSAPGGGGSRQACAACKYQRRKCAEDCLLAPYFPASLHRQFLNVHRFFGVSNVMKVLREVKPGDRETAVQVMISEANVRAADPVGGCYRILCQLRSQIVRCEAELDLVLRQLAACRAKAADVQTQNPSSAVFEGMEYQRPQFMSESSSSWSPLPVHGYQPYANQEIGANSKLLPSVFRERPPFSFHPNKKPKK